MAPSAKHSTAILAASAVIVSALALGGCDTTSSQTKSARLDLQIERKQAILKPTKLKGKTASVKVVSATAVRGKKTGAIAVVVRNDGNTSVNDLPMGVGVRGSDGKDAYLNLDKRVPYFQSHLPAIAPGKQVTWVFTSDGPLPAGEPFARVGGAPNPPLAKATTVPQLTASKASAPSGKDKDKPVIEARITNGSDIPQYDVEVYASASKGGSLVAAGATKVGEIDPGQQLTVRVPVTGSPAGAKPKTFAPPTIFD